MNLGTHSPEGLRNNKSGTLPKFKVPALHCDGRLFRCSIGTQYLHQRETPQTTTTQNSLHTWGFEPGTHPTFIVRTQTPEGLRNIRPSTANKQCSLLFSPSHSQNGLTIFLPLPLY